MAPSSSLILFGIVIGAAVAASIIVYEYTKSVGTNIGSLSSENTRSNARIQAHDASQIFANTVDSVRANLQILSASQSVQNGEISRARTLFAAAQNATTGFTDSYFWVDADGSFSGQMPSQIRPFTRCMLVKTGPTESIFRYLRIPCGPLQVP